MTSPHIDDVTLGVFIALFAVFTFLGFMVLSGGREILISWENGL